MLGLTTSGLLTRDGRLFGATDDAFKVHVARTLTHAPDFLERSVEGLCTPSSQREAAPERVKVTRAKTNPNPELDALVTALLDEMEDV